MDPRLKKTIQALIGAAIVAAGAYGLLPDSAEAAPNRTLPHDHTTRGKGGDIGADVTHIHPLVVRESVDNSCEPELGTGNCQNVFFFRNFDNTGLSDAIGWLGYSASGNLRLRNAYEGGDVQFAAENTAGNEEVYMLYDSSAKRTFHRHMALFPGKDSFATTNTGIELFGEGSGTPHIKTTISNESGTILGDIGYHNRAGAASNDWNVSLLQNGGDYDVWSDDTGGTAVNLFAFDPDGGFELYEDGLLRFTGDNNGANVYGSTSGAATANHTMEAQWRSQDGNVLGEIQIGEFSASDTIHISNFMDDGTVEINANDGTAQQSLWEGDPTNRIITEIGGGRFYAIKTADETVTNSTTFQDDDHLTVSSVPVGNYSFEMSMRMSGASADDIKFNFASAADTVVGLQIVGCTWISDDGTMSQDAANVQSTTLIAQTIGGSSITVTTCTGIYEVQTAGDVQMQWAQNAASVVAGTIYEGSWLRMEKYGN